MLKLKTILSLFLSALLVLSFSACTKDTADTGVVTVQTAEDTTAAEEDETAAPTDTAAQAETVPETETEEQTVDVNDPPDIVDTFDVAETEPEETDDEAAEYPGNMEYEGDIKIASVPQKDENITNYLFIGRDQGSGYGRADSAMIISYNKTEKTAKIISLLRDSYVPIEGHNWNKLGHALAYGGIGLYINTVNFVLESDVQKYAVVDFGGVSEIVDAVGGITVELSEAEVEYYAGKWDFNVGENQLDGEQALAYARNRSLAGTDFARAERQRKVLVAIYRKLMNSDPRKALKTVQKILTYLSTNIPAGEMLNIAANIIDSRGLKNIEMTQMPFEGTWKYAHVTPPGYTGQMSVTQIDIEANRKAFSALVYGE